MLEFPGFGANHLGHPQVALSFPLAFKTPANTPSCNRRQILTNPMAQFGGQQGTLEYGEPLARIQSWPLVG